MAQKWSDKYMWPADNYIVRVMEENLKNSKNSGAPMIEYILEVAGPETQEIDGILMEVIGRRLWHYATLQSKNEDGSLNEENTLKMLARHQKEFFSKVGLVLTDENNPDINAGANPPLGLKGKLIHVSMNCRKEVLRKTPTKAELAAGKTEGEVRVNPATGEPLIKYVPFIDGWFCLAKEDGSKPY